MKFKTNSIYSINKKNPNRMIFDSVSDNEEYFIELKDGVVTEHYINNKDGQASYSTISKSITVDTFFQYKTEHDEELHQWDNAESDDGKMTCSIHLLEDTTLVSVPSPQEIMSKEADEIEMKAKQDKRKEKGLAIFAKLTEVQKRRYKMYVVDGKSMREIAGIEGTSHQSIHETIKAIEKKIKKSKNNF